jgi:hypothetical protein
MKRTFGLLVLLFALLAGLAVGSSSLGLGTAALVGVGVIAALLAVTIGFAALLRREFALGGAGDEASGTDVSVRPNL